VFILNAFFLKLKMLFACVEEIRNLFFLMLLLKKISSQPPRKVHINVIQ